MLSQSMLVRKAASTLSSNYLTTVSSPTSPLTIVRAKLIALGAVLLLIAYHGVLRHTGYDSCQDLLTTGEFRGDSTWQPQGCLIHNYTRQELVRCMSLQLEESHKSRVYFIGEHRVRSLYYLWLRQVLGKDQSPQDAVPEAGSHAEDDRGLQADFVWSPFLGDALLQTLESAAKSDGSTLVILGSGLHYITESKRTTSESYQEFSDQLVQLTEIADKFPETTTILWKTIEPLTEAREEKAFNLDNVNADIAKYNRLAAQLLNGSRVLLWNNIEQMTAQNNVLRAQGGEDTPLHQTDDVLMQVLFNHQCNRLLQPNDGSCCVPKEAVTWTQITLLLLCGLVGIWSLKICCRQPSLGTPRPRQGEPATSPEVSVIIPPERKGMTPSPVTPIPESVPLAILRLAAVLVYFYMCDRGNYFLKENKYVSVFHFYLAVAAVAAVCMSTIRQSTQSTIMHRDITDELKGWMQLVILSYHMTGSSYYLPVYMHIRFLVSFYLFLTGFGHFIYAWSGKKMTFARYCQVMFRLNFLAVMLCLVMSRGYQFYYFVALVSFWFSILYGTLALPPLLLPPIYGSRHTPRSYVYGLAKIAALIAVITFFFNYKNVFETVFLFPLWSSIFQGTDGTVNEWFFRWSLDRYSVLYGAGFALLYRWIVERGWLDDGSTSNLHRNRMRVLLMLLLGVVLLPSYLYLLQYCDTKPTCNAWHPFLLWSPVLGYIILRNEIGYIRTKFSSAMAWCGRISLELFVSQYHIWLAQDTYGMLVLVPGYPVINMIVITFVLVCVAHEIHSITNILAGALVPSVGGKLLRNIVCFALLLFSLSAIEKYIHWFV